jgi:hypothetical protein
MAGHRGRARKGHARRPAHGRNDPRAERARRAQFSERRRTRYAQDPHFRRKILASNRAERRRKCYAKDAQYRRRVDAGNKAYRAAHKDERNARQRERYASDAEYRERMRARHRGEPRRKSWLSRKYGLTLEDYEAMRARQNDVCAICKMPSRRRLEVDHCHATGMVRGLLCQACNVGLGRFKDRPALLRAAADYLAAARCTTRP